MAFVIVHLQNVVTNSEKNRMTTTALGKLLEKYESHLIKQI